MDYFTPGIEGSYIWSPDGRNLLKKAGPHKYAGESTFKNEMFTICFEFQNHV